MSDKLLVALCTVVRAECHAVDVLPGRTLRVRVTLVGASLSACCLVLLVAYSTACRDSGAFCTAVS